MMNYIELDLNLKITNSTIEQPMFFGITTADLIGSDYSSLLEKINPNSTISMSCRFLKALTICRAVRKFCGII